MDMAVPRECAGMLHLLHLRTRGKSTHQHDSHNSCGLLALVTHRCRLLLASSRSTGAPAAAQSTPPREPTHPQVRDMCPPAPTHRWADAASVKIAADKWRV